MVQESRSNTTASSEANQNPRNLWQWMMMYPALFIALLGNTPHLVNAITAFQQGVPPTVARSMREQARLWSKNIECIGQQRSVAESKADELAIGVTLCPSGDMLVSIDDADPQNGKRVNSIRHWVAFNAVPENSIHPVSAILMPQAIAATINNRVGEQPSSSVELAQVTVICQKSLGNGQVLRRLKYQDGRCEDEVVNTLTGEVVSRSSAPQCSADC